MILHCTESKKLKNSRMFVDNEAGEADVISVFIYSPFLYSGSYDLSYAAVKTFTSMSICRHIVSFFCTSPELKYRGVLVGEKK